MQILLAGFGNMGQALARGWLASDSLSCAVTVLETSDAARRAAVDMGFTAVASADSLGQTFDVCVIAVKPVDVAPVLRKCPDSGLYLSIAAGKTIRDLASHLHGEAAIVRAMPNTPAAIGQGVTGLCANEFVTAAKRETASGLMHSVGRVEWLDNESDMDVLTAVSGSGPAYVFLVIEALTAAATDAGLPADLAARLATATVSGAGAYAEYSDLTAAELRRQVTSPNGTTQAALEVLMEGDRLKKLFANAVEAAAQRSRELGAVGQAPVQD